MRWPPGLESRIADLEDSLVERKKGIYNHDEIRKVVVSFENSLLEGQTAVLLIGVAADGAVTGVSTDDVEKYQQKVRRICADDCFPPITIRSVTVVTIEGKHVIAFEFGPSLNRPHFAGHAYVRTGSASVQASPEKLNELIASRNTAAGRLLAAKERHELITVVIPDRALIPGQAQLSSRREWLCTVESCDAQTVRICDQATLRLWDLPIEFLIFGRDPKGRMLVEYTRTR